MRRAHKTSYVSYYSPYETHCDVGIPTSITELCAKEEDLEEIVEDALKDVITGGNPRETNTK